MIYLEGLIKAWWLNHWVYYAGNIVCHRSVQGCDYIDGIMNDVVGLRLVVVFLSKCAFCNTLRLLRKRCHKLLFYCHKARCVYGRVYLRLCSHSFISSLLKIKCKCYWIKEQTAAAGLYGRVNECVPNADCCSDLIFCFMSSAGRRCVCVCKGVCAHVTFCPSLMEHLTSQKTLTSLDQTPLKVLL